ncbi:MAG: DUF2878 domain-containing protein [Arenicellales bacterium]|nr:DUF2878 domain-containing protein [Arenicellales bacterium]
MNKQIIVNMVFLQGLWFAVILGAAHEWMAPALICLVLFCLYQFFHVDNPRQEAAVVMFATLLGSILDSVWVQLGWLKFSYPIPHAGLAPFWIAMLWAGFGLTLNHSLRWLQNRLVLAAVFSMISAPLSYFAASRLGAVEILYPSFIYPALSLSWAVVIPCLLVFARSWHRPSIIGQPL